MTLLPGAIAAILSLPAAAQDAPPTPADAIRSRELTFRSLEGILEVTVCGVNGEKHVVVRVNGERARDAVRAELGERIDGYRLIIVVCPPPKEGAVAAAPTAPARPTVAAPPPVRPADEEVEGCDLIPQGRKIRHRSSARCVIMRRTVFGGSDGRDPYALLRVTTTPWAATPWVGGRGYLPGTWSCEYPKHRDDCPIVQGMRQQWVQNGTPPPVGVPLVATPYGPQPLPPPPCRPRIYYCDGWYGPGLPHCRVPWGGWRR